MPVAGLKNFRQADGLASQLSTDRAAEEPLLVENADLADVARVITDDERVGKSAGG